MLLLLLDAGSVGLEVLSVKIRYGIVPEKEINVFNSCKERRHFYTALTQYQSKIYPFLLMFLNKEISAEAAFPSDH